MAAIILRAIKSFMGHTVLFVYLILLSSIAASHAQFDIWQNKDYLTISSCFSPCTATSVDQLLPKTSLLS